MSPVPCKYVRRRRYGTPHQTSTSNAPDRFSGHTPMPHSAPTKESEQAPKKSEPAKTYENQIGQTQLDSHIHPTTSKNPTRYTKRQIDSSFNEENSEKEIKNIEDKNQEDIKEI